MFSKDLRIRILRCSYLGALVVMVVLIAVILATRTSNYVEPPTDSYVSIDGRWTLTPGGEDYVNVKKLGQYYTDGSDTLSIYFTIPSMERDESLIFRSKDVYCSLYMDNKLVYSPQIYESPVYNASPGNNWNFYTISSNDSGKVIELRIKYVYDSQAVTVDNLFYGSKADWTLHFVVSKIWAIFISVLIIFAGVIMVSMDHSTYKRSQRHSLLYLGIYSILMGLWSLLETNTIQIAFNDGRFIQLFDNVLMVTDSLPLFLYLDSEFDILKHRIFRILTLIDILYIYACLIGQITGLTDMHNLLKGAWIATGLSFFILVGIFARQIKSYFRGEEIKKTVIIQTIGMVVLMLLVIICLPIYIRSDGIDRAASIRFGMLAMVITFAIAAQVQTYELIKQGTRYDIVKNLAYQDALTGLKNRTSYLETLDNYKENPPANLGVIFFDVNNLKLANDEYGHGMGDKLISTAADIISQSFNDLGIAYRTGGDEFIVFIESDNPKKQYDIGIELFNRKIAAQNISHTFPFEFAIAHGFAIKGEKDGDYLESMIKDADNRMYENKRILKEGY